MKPDAIRSLFSHAMSDMYRAEVPQYGALCSLVGQVNARVLDGDSALAQRMREDGQTGRLDVERHGAVRVGTAQELATMRRLFGVMGMQAVGYYDLSVAGVPVHATAFRPVDDASLDRNPFRVFTSLLRTELIADEPLRRKAESILACRRIFTAGCLAMIDRAEGQGSLSGEEAHEFVREALETFRWHAEATVDLKTYQRLRAAHPLVADIVCFKGPHINHLTPRTLDIDAVQAGMPAMGIQAKKSIEGPPPRAVPILLRQTSFLALQEPIRFLGEGGDEGTHTARFGEIEQRGCALTRKGRALYDLLLSEATEQSRLGTPIDQAMRAAFGGFPDDEAELHKEGLAFYSYEANLQLAQQHAAPERAPVSDLVEGGWLTLAPLTYEDFLPVSAAGIFTSNLGDGAQLQYQGRGKQDQFEAALGARVLDEIALYQQTSERSLAEALSALSRATSIQVAT
ncbi:VOC family protein [Variovorax guangxiensis]|uniref:2-oxoadipate dioxygenase/decarboxylase HglS n=1 Tax=Variovorax guangxiensis TaxID=1775474 RepID=UPI0028604CA5|nr:VOC family protein [Variovorax guangxiensis]MDR6857535.1 putative glyoxalase superfamily metalloenzyme YdcJ [Variovorax guangxiensis]